MTEVEVSLRLALYLLKNDLTTSDVRVAIDGAQVRTGSTVHFEIVPFLREAGFRGNSEDRWQCRYCSGSDGHGIVVHSSPGEGDVVAGLRDGRTLRVESKKGPLEKRPGSPEYRLMREAIGQLMTVPEAAPDDYLAIAVPQSRKFKELADRWEQAPLISQVGIGFLLVSPDGNVTGFKGSAVQAPH